MMKRYDRTASLALVAALTVVSGALVALGSGRGAARSPGAWGSRRELLFASGLPSGVGESEHVSPSMSQTLLNAPQMNDSLPQTLQHAWNIFGGRHILSYAEMATFYNQAEN